MPLTVLKASRHLQTQKTVNATTAAAVNATAATMPPPTYATAMELQRWHPAAAVAPVQMPPQSHVAAAPATEGEMGGILAAPMPVDPCADDAPASQLQSQPSDSAGSESTVTDAAEPPVAQACFHPLDVSLCSEQQRSNIIATNKSCSNLLQQKLQTPLLKDEMTGRQTHLSRKRHYPGHQQQQQQQWHQQSL